MNDLYVNDGIEQVREMLQAEHLDGVLVSSQANLSWLFGGRFHINIATEMGPTSVFITESRVECLVNNIEHERLLQEEGLTADVVHVYPWYDESRQRRVLDDWMEHRRVKSDAELVLQFRRMRTAFDAWRLEQLRVLGKHTADVVETACHRVDSDTRECDVAAELAGGCYRAGLDPVAVMVAGERRAQLYRHPLPTDAPLQRYAILSLCARQYGLVVSVSRMVALSLLPQEIVNKHRAAIEVEAVMISATRPGVAVKSILHGGIDAYQRVGFAQEWTHHHQGGLAGYQSRELRAMPDSDETVKLHQAFAWNPTISGVKSEDTFLVTEQENEIITETGSFPLVDVAVRGNTVRRPAILHV